MKKIIIHCIRVILFISMGTVIHCSMAEDTSSALDVVGPKSVVQPRSKDGEQRKLVLGREYYYTLLDKGLNRHWAVPIAFNFVTTDRYFNSCGKLVDNATGLFGDPVQLSDIYLASRIAADNLMSSQFVQPTATSRTAGQVLNPPYGAYENEIYLDLLADVQIGFSGVQQKETSFVLSGIYRFGLTACDELEMAIGVELPIKTRMHTQALTFINGSLFTQNLIPGSSTGQGTANTDSLKQFFNSTNGYSGLEDFVLRQVFGSKGITFNPNIVKTGIGDVSLYVLFDFAGYTTWAEGLQVGVNFVFPTGALGCSSTLFDPSLGCGVYSYEPFFNAIFTSCTKWFNPSFRFTAQINGKRNFTCASGNGISVPTATSLGRVQLKNTNINFPPFFADYFVGPFTGEYDSLVPAFAAQAPTACVKRGNKFLVGVGDYIFDIFTEGFRLGLFYDYEYKQCDRVAVPCAGTYNTAAVTANTKTQSHSIGVNLTYKFKNYFELNIGTDNVIAGVNVPRTHEFFASLIAVF